MACPATTPKRRCLRPPTKRTTGTCGILTWGFAGPSCLCVGQALTCWRVMFAVARHLYKEAKWETAHQVTRMLAMRHPLEMPKKKHCPIPKATQPAVEARHPRKVGPAGRGPVGLRFGWAKYETGFRCCFFGFRWANIW